ncbi:MAG: hypothetical protein AAB914_00865, partial [Patescibacteria group bacterium]
PPPLERFEKLRRGELDRKLGPADLLGPERYRLFELVLVYEDIKNESFCLFSITLVVPDKS